MSAPAERGIPDLAAAAARLRRGGVVAFPTETVYGLGADVFDIGAVQRVFELKGRPSRNPLIVHVSGPEMARRVASEWPGEANRLASAFWPGPLSIVLSKRTDVPDIVTGGVGSTSVAVRCPDHPVALALLYEFGGPLVGPSANKSGSVSPTTAEHVRSAFRESDVFVLDGGACATGIESTVVSLAGAIARVLRPGVIGAAELSRVLGRHVEPATAGTVVGGLPNEHESGPLPSPGLLTRHYAPAVPARLLSRGEIESVLREMTEPTAPARVVLAQTIREVPPPHRVIVMPGDEGAYAAGLYAALRAAEAMSPAEILIEHPPPPTDGATWEAVWDRLRRACAKP